MKQLIVNSMRYTRTVFLIYSYMISKILCRSSSYPVGVGSVVMVSLTGNTRLWVGGGFGGVQVFWRIEKTQSGYTNYYFIDKSIRLVLKL